MLQHTTTVGSKQPTLPSTNKIVGACSVANRTTWEPRPSDVMRLADDDTLASSAKHGAPTAFGSLFHSVPQPAAARNRGGWRKLNTAVRIGGQFKSGGMAAALATDAQVASNIRGQRWAAAGRKLTKSLANMEAQRLAPVDEGEPPPPSHGPPGACVASSRCPDHLVQVACILPFALHLCLACMESARATVHGARVVRWYTSAIWVRCVSLMHRWVTWDGACP